MDKIKTLSIDLETFSDVDLAKCGVYRYIESPAFEILLFGVSVNGGDVAVYDLAQGEEIPADILSALTDNSVINGHSTLPLRECVYQNISVYR